MVSKPRASEWAFPTTPVFLQILGFFFFFLSFFLFFGTDVMFTFSMFEL